MIEEPNITIDEIRAVGHCPKGIRRWCEANDIDFKTLIRDGFPKEVLLATGDGIAEDAIQKIMARRHSGG